MPIHEYVCDDCQTRFERILMSPKQEINCPKCSSKRHTLQLSVFSTGSKSNSGSNGGSFSGGSCGCTPSSCGCH